MPRRVTALAVALVVTFGGFPAAAAPVALDHAGRVAAATPEPPTSDNSFVPADRDLSECISAAPQPSCGSESHGGWRQGLVFGVVVAALAFVAWRIVRTVRRNRRSVEAGHGR